MAQRAEATVDERFCGELRTSSCPCTDRSVPLYSWTVYRPTLTTLIQGVYAYLAVSCRLHFRQNDRGLVSDTAVTQRFDLTPIFMVNLFTNQPRNTEPVHRHLEASSTGYASSTSRNMHGNLPCTFCPDNWKNILSFFFFFFFSFDCC